MVFWKIVRETSPFFVLGLVVAMLAVKFGWPIWLAAIGAGLLSFPLTFGLNSVRDK